MSKISVAGKKAQWINLLVLQLQRPESGPLTLCSIKTKVLMRVLVSQLWGSREGILELVSLAGTGELQVKKKWTRFCLKDLLDSSWAMICTSPGQSQSPCQLCVGNALNLQCRAYSVALLPWGEPTESILNTSVNLVREGCWISWN